jgi:hypothetical protein
MSTVVVWRREIMCADGTRSIVVVRQGSIAARLVHKHGAT